jgi:hypothetical protein
VTGLTLDAGALIAYERERRSVTFRLRLSAEAGTPVFVPAGVLAQAWRDGRRQARLAHLLTRTWPRRAPSASSVAPRAPLT